MKETGMSVQLRGWLQKKDANTHVFSSVVSAVYNSEFILGSILTQNIDFEFDKFTEEEQEKEEL